MADVSVAILGLGRLGASIGLALKRYNRTGSEHTFTIGGYDTDPENVRTAQKMGAVDEANNRPESIVKNRDIVVMAMPYGEVGAAYDLIKQNLRPGVVILDLSALKGGSTQWAQKNLSEDTHLVCAAPIVNPAYLFSGTNETRLASEDYFDKGVMYLMPGVKSIKEAIALAGDFARILGSDVRFADAIEYDALVASTEALPNLLGVVYFHALLRSQGWEDVQRFSNPAMTMLTRPLFDTHSDDMVKLMLDARGDLVRVLDEFTSTLREYRTALANGDRHALENALETNAKAYEGWINRRHNNRWKEDEDLKGSSGPSFGDVMGNMFGSFLTNRIRGGKKNDE
ncbi:MAG: hypothetical protein OHK0046_40200 [Anaerolineae bacterium]